MIEITDLATRLVVLRFETFYYILYKKVIYI